MESSNGYRHQSLEMVGMVVVVMVAAVKAFVDKGFHMMNTLCMRSGTWMRKMCQLCLMVTVVVSRKERKERM